MHQQMRKLTVINKIQEIQFPSIADLSNCFPHFLFSIMDYFYYLIYKQLLTDHLQAKLLKSGRAEACGIDIARFFPIHGNNPDFL